MQQHIRAIAALVVGATAVLGLAAPATAAPISAGTVIERDPAPDVATLFEATNAQRLAVGLRPLRFAPDLHEIAQEWTIGMAEIDELAHRYRYRDLYPAGSASGGEIVAYSWGSDPSRLMNWWMNSTDHRNIIRGNYTHVGYGSAVATDSRQNPSGELIWGTGNFARYTDPTALPSFGSVEGWQQSLGVTGLDDVVGQIHSVDVGASGGITVRGWAYDLSDPSATVSLSIWVEGASPIRVTANRAWGDLAMDGVPGAHGFTAFVPNAPAGQFRVCALAANAVGGGDHLRFPCTPRATSAAPAPEVTRIPARDMMQASVDLSAAHAVAGSVREVYLVPSASYSIPLAVAPAAARPDRSMLLVDAGGASPALLDELRRLRPGAVTIVGDTQQMPMTISNQVRAVLPSATLARVAGASTSETTTRFAQRAFGRVSDFHVATIENLSDTVSASSAAAALGTPLVLAERTDQLTAAVRAYAQAQPGARATVVGLTPSMAAAHAQQLASATGATPVVLRGADRFITNERVLAAAWSGGQERVFLGSGLNFGHSALASAIATSSGPLALTAVACVPPDNHRRITGDWRVQEVVAMGMQWTVSDDAAALRACS